MKLAMIRLHQKLQAGLPGKLLLQVHDELVLEVPKSQQETLVRELRSTMEEVLSLQDITLKVDIHTADNWALAKD
jgi:DNA polymerase-1